jgi:hypothetical protein
MLENISNLKYNRAYEAIYKTSHTRRYPQGGESGRENYLLKSILKEDVVKWLRLNLKETNRMLISVQ